MAGLDLLISILGLLYETSYTNNSSAHHPEDSIGIEPLCYRVIAAPGASIQENAPTKSPLKSCLQPLLNLALGFRHSDWSQQQLLHDCLQWYNYSCCVSIPALDRRIAHLFLLVTLLAEPRTSDLVEYNSRYSNSGENNISLFQKMKKCPHGDFKILVISTSN